MLFEPTSQSRVLHVPGDLKRRKKGKGGGRRVREGGRGGGRGGKGRRA